MWLIPYARITIRTHLDQEEALQKLYEAIEPVSLLARFRPKHKLYEGVIYGYRFSVIHLSWLNNAFSLTIKGDIYLAEGSSIHIKIYPHIFTLIWMIVGSGLFGCTFIGSLLTGILSTIEAGALQPSLITSICPAIFLAMIYALVIGTFMEEFNRAKRFFPRLFQAHQVDIVGITSLFARTL